ALSCVLWRSLSMERSRGAQPMEHRDVVAIAADVRHAVDLHAGVVKRLAYRSVTSTADWVRSAHGQISTLPAFAAIAWVTPALDRAGPERPAGGPLAWTPIGLPGAPDWRLRAWRGGSRLVPADSPLPEIVLGVGLLLAVFAGVGAHFVDEGGRRTKAARRVNN